MPQAHSCAGVEMRGQAMTEEHEEFSSGHVQDALGSHSRKHLAKNWSGQRGQDNLLRVSSMLRCERWAEFGQGSKWIFSNYGPRETQSRHKGWQECHALSSVTKATAVQKVGPALLTLHKDSNGSWAMNPCDLEHLPSGLVKWKWSRSVVSDSVRPHGL